MTAKIASTTLATISAFLFTIALLLNTSTVLHPDSPDAYRAWNIAGFLCLALAVALRR